MKNKLMKCGCAPQGFKKVNGKQVECCIVHNCIEPIEQQPDLTGRTARCSYFGQTKPMRRYANDECNYGCQGNSVCRCGSVPSSFDLAFFEYKPNCEQDIFYCGCHGWD